MLENTVGDKKKSYISDKINLLKEWGEDFNRREKELDTLIYICFNAIKGIQFFLLTKKGKNIMNIYLRNMEGLISGNSKLKKYVETTDWYY